MKAILFKANALQGGYMLTWEDLETRKLFMYDGELKDYRDVQIAIELILLENPPETKVA